MRSELAAARAAHRDAARALRELRQSLRGDPRIFAEMSTIAMRATELQRSARAHCGVYWGTYLPVEDSVRAMAKAPLYEDDAVTPHDPSFVPWTGHGAVSVQLQRHQGLEDVTSDEHPQVLVTLPDENAWYSACRGTRRRVRRTAELALRVASDTDKKPIWARWVLDMHRPLPADGRIKRATVRVDRMGPNCRWYVLFTVESELQQAAPRGTGIVALDVGWRVLGDDIRVAVWRDDAGQTGELRLDARTVDALREPAELRGERDLRFNAARVALKTWLDSLSDPPPWLLEATNTMHAWRSPSRLAALWRSWGQKCSDVVVGEPEARAYSALTAWYWRDRHLWACEARRRARSLGRRREIYRVFAAHLAKRYGTIVLEGDARARKPFDLDRLGRLPATEAIGAGNEATRHNRKLAAIGGLRNAILDAASSRRCAVGYVAAIESTRTCQGCGHVEPHVAFAAVHHCCTACGMRWDQDDNAAAVILQRWLDRLAEGSPNAELVHNFPQSRETRWLKAKRLAREKAARQRGHIEGDNDAG
jgi:hypothetical protein